MAAPLLKGTDFVLLWTRDWERAVEFYGSTLGLPVLHYERIPGGEFETGNLTLQVIQADALGREFERTPTPVAFHVDDVEAARAQLEAEGVTFHGEILDSGVCHQAFFTDPDGNAFALHHRYAPRTAEATPIG